MRTALCLTLLFLLPSASSAAVVPGPQVEVDRIVVRVAGRIITQSDIRQARTLRLVDDPSSDEACRRGLEDRWLMLQEMARAAPIAAPAGAEVSARRTEWERGFGGAAEVGRLLAESGMSEEDLQTWLRDDLRIRAYLRRQIGMLPEADRARATSERIARLRQRADVR